MNGKSTGLSGSVEKSSRRHGLGHLVIRDVSRRSDKLSLNFDGFLMVIPGGPSK